MPAWLDKASAMSAAVTSDGLGCLAVGGLAKIACLAHGIGLVYGSGCGRKGHATGQEVVASVSVGHVDDVAASTDASNV
jgi:hypothetical protein